MGLETVRVAVVLIAMLALCDLAKSAPIASCGGEVFGAVKLDLIPNDQGGDRVPGKARELYRGVWLSTHGFSVNAGIDSYFTVDIDTGTAISVLSTRSGVQPGNGYEVDETAQPGQAGERRWRKVVALSADQIQEITCLANAIWSHRPRWEINFQRVQREYEVASRAMEQESRRRNGMVKRCERNRLTRDYLRCIDALPPLPTFPLPPDVPSIEHPDPDLFSQATDVFNYLILRDNEASREVGGPGVFAGKSQALAVAVQKLFR